MVVKTWEELYGESATEVPKVETIANMTKEELSTMALEKLSIALQCVDARTNPELTVRLSNAVLDRIDGRPGQSQNEVVPPQRRASVLTKEQRDAAFNTLKG